MKWHRSMIPIETLAINTVGSFVFGLTAHQRPTIVYIAGIGFAGAFTTWSSFTQDFTPGLGNQHIIFDTDAHSTQALGCE